MSDYYIITFKNTHGAIGGEKLLKDKGFEILVMPTPTSITKSCGISLRIKIEDFHEVYKLAKSNVLEVEKIYLKTRTEYNLVDL